MQYIGRLDQKMQNITLMSKLYQLDENEVCVFETKFENTCIIQVHIDESRSVASLRNANILAIPDSLACALRGCSVDGNLSKEFVHLLESIEGPESFFLLEQLIYQHRDLLY